MGHSECVSLGGYCLGPDKVFGLLLWALALTTHNAKLFLSVFPSPGGSALLSLLQQRGLLAAPNLNLLCTPPELELEALAETEWYDSRVEATFPSLSA